MFYKGYNLNELITNPDENFPGITSFANPPDTVMDVGPNHIVQMVNVTQFQVWDKNGNPLTGVIDFGGLWPAGDPCRSNRGDPIVVYDHLADRWLFSQFALNFPDDFHECIAISQTGDPTGAWHLYDFQISISKMNDYPKFGVWPDGYYMAVNQFDGSHFAWAGQGVVVFERDQMLQGQPAQMVYFDNPAPWLGGMLPSDLDGPPPTGTPNFFI